MNDTPCTCVYRNGPHGMNRLDHDQCPHPEHGTHYRPGRTVRIGFRSYYPGELISTEDVL